MKTKKRYIMLQHVTDAQFKFGVPDHVELRTKYVTVIQRLTTLLKVIPLSSIYTDPCGSGVRNEGVRRYILKAINKSRSFWLRLTSSCEGWVARRTHWWSDADAWPSAFGQSVFFENNEVSINVEDLQNYLFWGLNYRHTDNFVDSN